MEVMIARRTSIILLKMVYRWSAEGFFSGVKRVFSETCRSKPEDALFSRGQVSFTICC